MIPFQIERPNDAIRPCLQEKIDNLTKPKGALGDLETLALQVGWVQQTLEPRLCHPCHIIFAGDHGIAAEGVSLSPQEVTRQMIVNFWQGGAGINFLARQHRFDLRIADAGVNFDFCPTDPILHLKIRKGTRNYLHEAAMTTAEMNLAIERGAATVDACAREGCNVIGFGEMGIANTSASALWMACLTHTPLEQSIGAGCDHTGAIIAHKQQVLARAMAHYDGDGSPADIIRYFGGYEMVMAVGAMLRAAERKMLILVDGFIMTNCVLAAQAIHPGVTHYCIFGHQGDESGHKRLLSHLGARPLLHLGMRLGEGTGALCAYPLVDSAVRMINEMNSFRKIEVTKYF
jgi:nicotinate-nucleotide--dimethylbenzimidazole phosphoribosyltransferase